MIGVTYKLKDMFFDRLAVTARLGEDRAKFLRNAGGWIRTTAIRSMRRVGKKGKPSKPGTPPKFHGNEQFSLRTILYGFNGIDSVIIGPIKGNQKSYASGVLATGTVPNLHEFGGVAGIREKRVGMSWQPMGKRKPRPGQPTRVRKANFPARPFMKPAGDKAKASGKFKQLWYGSGISPQRAA